MVKVSNRIEIAFIAKQWLSSGGNFASSKYLKCLETFFIVTNLREGATVF